MLPRRLEAVLGRFGSLAVLAGLAAALMGATPATSQAACAAVTPPVTLAAAPPTQANPTRRCSSGADLDDLLRSDFTGTVLIPANANWEMVRPCGGYDELGRCYDTPLREIPLRSGVHLIGERGPLGSRPTLHALDRLTNYPLFVVQGDDVRVEGLHLLGPGVGSRAAPPRGRPCDTARPCKVTAVLVVEDPVPGGGQRRRVVIADNELDQWPGAGVEAVSEVQLDEEPTNYTGPRVRPQDAGLVRIERNYFHHIARDGAGYGVAVGGSAYVTIEGNVFDFNRHAVSSDYRAYKGYIARFNYVLQGGHRYGCCLQQHFDVHGSGTPESRAQGHYDGGPGGEYFVIAYNTIRGEQSRIGSGTRPAFELRGRPVRGAYFNANVLAHDGYGEAVRLEAGEDRSLNEDSPRTFNLHYAGNRYDTDYSVELAAGDFDGDGRTDVFVANGTAWWFSRASIRPWEFLRASSARTRDLGFADIDNDSVTDVLSRDAAGRIAYYRGGRGGPVQLTSSPVEMKDLRFGDFDGDGRSDIFYTRGRQWYVWYGATRAWTRVGSSSFPISAFLFGEFDGVRGTDVVAVTGGAWSYSSGATRPWARLNARLVTSFANAVAADFDGNGRTDIALDEGNRWRFSRDGRGPLTLLRQGRWFPPLKLLPIGRFDGGTSAMVVSFEPGRVVPFTLGERLLIWRGPGTGNAFTGRSSQNMR
jgi:hypothetical protein